MYRTRDEVDWRRRYRFRITSLTPLGRRIVEATGLLSDLIRDAGPGDLEAAAAVLRYFADSWSGDGYKVDLPGLRHNDIGATGVTEQVRAMLQSALYDTP